MMKRIARMGTTTMGRLAALLLAGAAGGCAYDGGAMDSPLARRTEWLSFVQGEDIRQACVPGAGERVRLVYNGMWDEQVRIYDLGQKGPRSLEQRVIGAADLTSISLSDPLAPWRGTPAVSLLSADQYAQLIAALAQSDAFRPPAESLWLASDSFYWVAASCHAGRFSLTAWSYAPDPSLRVDFVAPLLALDATGVAYNAPRPFGDAELINKPRAERQRWYLTIEGGAKTGEGNSR